MAEKKVSTHQSQKAACRCPAATVVKGPSLRLVSKVILPPVFEDKALILTASDWRRIMIMVEELGPISGSYQIAGSTLAGMCISFLCLCCSFIPSAVPVISWLWVLSVSAACTSGVTSAVCFLFHARLDAIRKRKQRALSVELNQIATRFAGNGE